MSASGRIRVGSSASTQSALIGEEKFQCARANHGQTCAQLRLVFTDEVEGSPQVIDACSDQKIRLCEEVAEISGRG